MIHKLLAVVTGLLLTAATMHVGAGLLGGHCCPKCGACEEYCYEECTVVRCRTVTETKPIKKIVYELKEVPYCSKAPDCTCGGCGSCPACVKCCAGYKRMLVKKEIVCGEKCVTKCVPEEVCELVPVACKKCGCKSHCK